jgi:hypothetical protein
MIYIKICTKQALGLETHQIPAGAETHPARFLSLLEFIETLHCLLTGLQLKWARKKHRASSAKKMLM